MAKATKTTTIAGTLDPNELTAIIGDHVRKVYGLPEHTRIEVEIELAKGDADGEAAVKEIRFSTSTSRKIE